MIENREDTGVKCERVLLSKDDDAVPVFLLAVSAPFKQVVFIIESC